jgi:pyruvate dehydrogenase E2 component (dihydrolipoamide acetyltransferase)
MPKMGDGMEEGTILRWIKHEGDPVAVEEPIAEIETDKANVEIPAEDSGILTRIVVGEGQTVPVGTVIAYIGEPGPSAGNGRETRPAEALTATPPHPAGAPSAPTLEEEKQATTRGPEIERVKASPLARKMAREMGIDLALLSGSGPGGRIVERDVEAYAERTGITAKPPAVSELEEVPAMAKPLAAPVAPSLTGQDFDISRMRKTIARRTVQSKQTIPHFYLVLPIEMDKAMNLLEEMNAENPEQKITVNDLVVKACAVALQKYPEVNVSFTPEEKIRRYTQINIGIAVGTDDGLTVPVIADCGSKTLRQISAEAKILIGKARSGTLSPLEMSGGTFSVSNLGMFGIEEFAAIINPPESAILAVGAVTPEVVVAEDGSFVVQRRMRVTLSCDHRTVDGLLGAKFLQELKRLLEHPLNLLA